LGLGGGDVGLVLDGEVAARPFDLLDAVLHVEVVRLPPLGVAPHRQRLALLAVALDLPGLLLETVEQVQDVVPQMLIIVELHEIFNR
jgi:hypothetical protein